MAAYMVKQECLQLTPEGRDRRCRLHVVWQSVPEMEAATGNERRPAAAKVSRLHIAQKCRNVNRKYICMATAAILDDIRKQTKYSQ